MRQIATLLKTRKLSSRSVELTGVGIASGYCQDVISLVKSCPPIDSSDASEPDCTAAVPPFDLLFRPTECAERRLAGGYSPPMPSSKLSIHEDSREWEDMEEGQFDKINHYTNTCYATKICSEEQESQEEQRQDGHQEFEQAHCTRGRGNPSKISTSMGNQITGS